MLILDRKKMEKIIISNGDDIIEVCVVRQYNNHVRIGINADKKYNIVREELLNNKEKYNAGSN